VQASAWLLSLPAIAIEDLKDRRDALLQELQKLIECMLHAFPPEGANSVKALNSTTINSISA
jgi:hypothetical protein